MNDARPTGMTPVRDVALVARNALPGAAAFLAAMLLAACGSAAAPRSGPAGSGAGGPAPTGQDSAGSTSTGRASADGATTAKVSLDVAFGATPTSPAAHYTLFCEPAGGTTPDPAAACAKLLTGENIFAPRPLHELCPMILQGGVRATVTGTYFGDKVHVTIFNGGCDLTRWAKLKSIFG